MDIANTLLDFGAKANAESKAGFSPLHLASQEGHVDMCHLLLEHGASANYKAKVREIHTILTLEKLSSFFFFFLDRMAEGCLGDIYIYIYIYSCFLPFA
jgi:ankyrin repeat protein